MATTRFACPNCGIKLKSEGALGSIIDCPKCGTEVTIPGEPIEPEPVSEEAHHEEADAPDTPTQQEPQRIKAPWEYAKEWARVRFALVLCMIAGGLTVVELAGGELIDHFVRRAYTTLELCVGLVVGLVIGGFRIYSKTEFRHAPRQWVSRPLLWTCVGIEGALTLVVTITAIGLAVTPPKTRDEPELPPELAKGLTPGQQQELRNSQKQLRDLQSGAPVGRDDHMRVSSIGFGIAVFLAGVNAILWPIYLKEFATSVKAQEVLDLGDKALDVLGPMFMLWVLSVTIYQITASVTHTSGVYRPQGKAVTVLGLLTIQVLLIRMCWGLRKSLRAKARLKKPKTKPKPSVKPM